MNLQTTFDAEIAEKTQRAQSFQGKLAFTQSVNFPSATSASLRSLR